MAIFKGQNAAIYIASGSPIDFTNEGMTPDTTYKIYTITDASKRFWNPYGTVTVQRSTDNGTTWTTVSPSEYTIQYPGGKVVFGTAQSSTTLIRASGQYYTVSLLGEAKEWSLDIEFENVDTTTMPATWRKYEAVMRGASGSLSHWWLDSTFLSLLDSLLGIECQVSSEYTYRFYARLTGDSISLAVDGIVEENLDFNVVGQVYY